MHSLAISFSIIYMPKIFEIIPLQSSRNRKMNLYSTYIWKITYKHLLNLFKLTNPVLYRLEGFTILLAMK